MSAPIVECRDVTLIYGIAFRSSETNWWTSPSNGVRVAISNVLVGSLGNYGPVSNVVDIGPAINTNFPDVEEERTYWVDTNNVFYQLIIPSIWITPREAYAAVDGSNVEFNVTGTNIPQGVQWSIIPTNFVGHAEFYISTTNFASVSPGSVATNYKVRATSIDNTNFYAEVPLTVIKVDMKSVIFTSDHGVLTDYTNDFAGAGGTVFNPRGWTATGTNNPISQTKDTKLTANVTLCVQPSGIACDLTGDGSLGYFTFHTNGLTSSGADQTFLLTADAKIPAQIDVLNQSINWSINAGGVTCVATSSGPHKVYVTWGNPTGGGYTEKRINWVCGNATGATNQESCADKIYDTLGDPADPPFEPGEKTNLGHEWELLDGNTFGFCDDQAYLMRLSVMIIGDGTAAVQLVRASTNAGAGNCLNFESRYCEGDGKTEKLLLMMGGELNLFEGCCETAGKYYAIWPKAKADNDYEMLKTLGNGGVTQRWGWFDFDSSMYIACEQPDSSPPIPQ